MIYIISDIHFCHKNIIEFEKSRNVFSDVNEMNEAIVENWNSVVKNDDTVFFLGDLGIGNEKEILHWASKLKGKINFIHGNHDNSKLVKGMKRLGWNELGYGHRIKSNGIMIYMSHFPMTIGARPKYFNLHGHIHSMESDYYNQINVCTDSDLFGRKIGEPIPLDEVLELIHTRAEENKNASIKRS